MQFVQKAVFSDEKISRDVLSVLGARGGDVARAFNAAKTLDRLKSVFEFVVNHDFIDTDSFEGYENDNRMSFVSFEKALRQLQHFTVDSTAYANEDVKRKKFFILLESLVFLEADMLIRLVQKRFDVDAVNGFLYPVKPKKKPVEVVDES